MKTIKQKPLTSEQKRCIDVIKEHGCIIRYEGGLWQKPNDKLKGFIPKEIGGQLKEDWHYPLEGIGTVTIKSLLTRNIIKASETKKTQYGEYPVKCKLS